MLIAPNNEIAITMQDEKALVILHDFSQALIF